MSYAQLGKLFEAIQENDVTTINLLLDENGSKLLSMIDAKTKKTAIQYACSLRAISEDIPLILLYFQANINEKSEEGLSAMHFGCLEQNWQVCKTLFNHKIEINLSARCNKFDFTPFFYAIACDPDTIGDVSLYFDILHYFLRDKQSITGTDPKGNSALHIAASYGNHMAVKFILKTELISVDVLNLFVF